jgi:hypothetical protein
LDDNNASKKCRPPGKREVLVFWAKVGGNLEMGTASFAKALNASRVDIHGNLLMNSHASFGGDVNLIDARAGLLETSAIASRINLSDLSGKRDLAQHRSIQDFRRYARPTLAAVQRGLAQLYGAT